MQTIVCNENVGQLVQRCCAVGASVAAFGFGVYCAYVVSSVAAAASVVETTSPDTVCDASDDEVVIRFKKYGNNTLLPTTVQSGTLCLDDRACPICFGTADAVLAPCFHKICTDCLSKQHHVACVKNACPVCRTDIATVVKSMSLTDTVTANVSEVVALREHVRTRQDLVDFLTQKCDLMCNEKRMLQENVSVLQKNLKTLGDQLKSMRY